jgi:alpha-methylacyl-CoA racemase
MTEIAAGQPRGGPLAGITIIEMAGLGPVPLAGLMLAEMGARVVRVERTAKGQPFLSLPPQFDLDRHGREILKVDLKQPQGVDLLLRLVASADVLLEGFRPGVMERMGLGPDECRAVNPGIVYGRMTGFGQEGPLAARAGHDLTYLALTGVLNAIGPRDGKPVPPLNLVADYGGGSMFLITGVLAALIERGRSGKGQVVDAAMVDGASMLAAPYFGFMASGLWRDRRGSNLLDSGAPFYDTYRCADGLHVAVACLEPQFFAEFARLLPLDEEFATAQYDTRAWPGMRAMIETRIAGKSRGEWTAVFAGTDACVAPVLSFDEAVTHEHNTARGTHVTTDGLTRPAPAPRFSRTPSQISRNRQTDARSTLAPFGFSDAEVERLAKAGVIGE